jgi:hypothetical protein
VLSITLLFDPLRPRMRVAVNRLNVADRHVGVNFHGHNRRMAEQHLNHSEVRAVLQHMCRR